MHEQTCLYSPKLVKQEFSEVPGIKVPTTPLLLGPLATHTGTSWGPNVLYSPA